MYTDEYIAPVSGRALASSMSLYTSPYWLYKCFIIPILKIYSMKGLISKTKVILE